ncbi:hypothetical protein SAMN04488038_11935 [Solimonas aquatica]|uniref:VOC domain-containing protein n=1 Tax=Solimonas aquatica TaxID=489703 RepID=A0A1H9M7H4_9GAMM|nr:VOC family protein [Solimonas aquatica]SER19435.1 hypothetical protein SAMN04488038_11935 [Solimonas aquatica]
MNPTLSASGVYINLPVKDVQKTRDFFTQLGFAFNPQFSNELAVCVILSENSCAMLLSHEHFSRFTPHAISDARQVTEVLVCLMLPSRAQVDELVAKAIAAGGSTYKEPEDHGFMYGHGFKDLDGHIWELGYMDLEAFTRAQQEQKQ